MQFMSFRIRTHWSPSVYDYRTSICKENWKKNQIWMFPRKSQGLKKKKKKKATTMENKMDNKWWILSSMRGFRHKSSKCWL